ncbi:MAG: ABC transporter substrate-binding protein [Ardenticatenaceae bacterium]|nr:ABC transporter substrate-binding protein [Ardenticatenaceae bacterium]
MYRKFWFLLILLAGLGMVVSCNAQPPQPAVQTVVVRETVVVQGTPQVVEKQVTTVVEKQVTTVVEKQVTTAPEVKAPPGGAARNETLNIAVSGRIADPTNLNIYAPGVSRSGTGLHQVGYEYLFYYNLQTGEYIPWLAESYKYNDDFTALTVKLRDGVTWNDGKPFTADDIVFTYDLLRENPGMVWAEEANKRVASVEKIDDLTVQFNLKEPSPRLHQNREAFPAVGIWGGITILPKHVWEGQDPLKFKNSQPVSTSAYTLKNASETAMTWERRDDWWGTKVFGVTPAPKIVNFIYAGPETNTALALAANELDTPNISILSLGSFLEVAKRNPKVTAWYPDKPYAWLDPCPRALMVQNAKAPWDKKEARWALSYLIDRQAIVDLAYEGTTVSTWGIWPYYDGLNPYFDAISDLREKYPTESYDPAKAEELLTSIGYKKGSDGAWTSADGKQLAVTYVVNADSTEEMKVAQVLADQLDAEGIKVELQPLSGGVLEDTTLRGNYDVKLHSLCPGYIYDNLELFHSKFYTPLGEKAPWFERNSFRYRNEAFDKIVDQMGQIPPENEKELTPLFHQAMEIWFDDLPVIPVVQAPALVPFNETYWVGWPNAKNPWNMPVSWWATFDLVITGYPSPETGKWVGGIKPAGMGGQ